MSSSFARIGINNYVLPKEGPKVFRALLDFRATAEQILDLTLQVQQGFVSYIQGGFFDNRLNTQPLVITADVTGQAIAIPAGKQAYMPIFMADPKLEFKTPSAGNLVIPIHLTNVPVYPIVF